MEVRLNIYRDWLREYLLPHWPRVLGLAVLLFGAIGFQIVNPQIMRVFIDSAIGGKPQKVLIFAALLFMGAALLHQVFSLFATYVSAKLGWTTTNLLRERLARHCLNQDLSFHHIHSPGELIERIDGDVSNLADFFSQFVVQILGNLLLLSGILIVLYLEDLRVGSALTVFATIALAVLLKMRNYAIVYWKKVREISAVLFGFIEEYLSGTEDIRANGAEAHVFRRLYQLSSQRLRTDYDAGMANVRLFGVMMGIFVIGHILAMGLAYPLYQAQAITLGTAFLIVQYTQSLVRPIQQLSVQMEELQKVGASLVRIHELLQFQRKVKDEGQAIFPDGPPSINFDSVNFGYEKEEVVLSEISFNLAPGRTLGLLGRTGSGKSTLIRLLLRFYDVASGAVRLSDVDVRMLPLQNLRQQVAMVTQQVQLFRGSIRDNLTFFDRSIPDGDILYAFEQLGLQEWFAALPDGLDTELRKSGDGLSAGEAQLLAFARVYLKDPRLLILDEASSRLDPATEEKLERAIRRLRQNRTCIIIAHRLATVQQADDILILSDGKMEEFGERESLSRDPHSRFSKLLKIGLETIQ